MPELPEVETIRAGIAPHISGKIITRVLLRNGHLRWPVVSNLNDILSGQQIISVSRRAKYLLLHTAQGCLIIHLGMSGSLRIYTAGTAPAAQKHDHADFMFDDGTVMRFHDPRRFGAILWFAGIPECHPLLASLGPEPLGSDFTAGYLRRAVQQRQRAIKPILMDNHVVVGVGNIYANEALFQAGILPTRVAKKLHRYEYELLVSAVRDVLQRAILAGGSTLRDFVNSDGRSGYFQQQYAVYGRAGEPCRRCGHEIIKITQAQRSSFYCPQCQH